MSRMSTVLSYEPKGIELRNALVMPGRQPNSAAGTRAFEAATAFRKTKVKRHIYRMVVRREIPVSLYDGGQSSFALPEHIRQHVALDFDIEGNHVGPSDASKYSDGGFLTDAIKLIAELEVRKAWVGNSCAIDWLRIEGFLRGRFESLGLPESNEKYVLEAGEWYMEASIDERDVVGAPLREFVRQLRAEYSFSEE